MKALVSFSLLSLLVSTSAFATGKHTTPTPPATPPAPVYSSNADASASSIAAAAAIAHQQQSLHNTNTANGGFATGGQGGQGGSAAATAQGGQGGSSSASSDNRSRNAASASNNQVINSTVVQPRQQRNNPNISAQFSSVVGNPCEGAPFGAGGSGFGLGALFQIPRESTNCWMERKALMVRQLGGSSTAAIAVLGGVDVITAVNSYGYQQQAVGPRRAYRAKRSRCVPCGR